MLIRVALLLVIVPLVEMVLLLTLADVMGFSATLAMVMLTGIGGAWLLRHQGFRTLRAIARELQGGRLPGREMMDGALLIIAGVLLLTPGLLTDLLAIGLLIPWTRSWFRSGLAAYFKSHWTIQSFRSNGSPSTSTSHHAEVIDSYVVPPGGEKPDAS